MSDFKIGDRVRFVKYGRNEWEKGFGLEIDAVGTIVSLDRTSALVQYNNCGYVFSNFDKLEMCEKYIHDEKFKTKVEELLNE